LRWEEIERHVSPNGEPFRQSCPNPFHLLIPHVCPPGLPSSSSNPAGPVPPTLRTSPPPRRPETFPPLPPDFAAAGPSRSTRSEAAQTPAATESNKSAISQTQIQTPGTGIGVGIGADGSGSGNGNGNGNGAKGRRSIRIQSEESDSRAPSPERSASPILKTKRKDRGEKDKKRARLSEGDATSTPGSSSRMDIDEEPKRLKVRNGARIDRTSQSREDSPAVSTVSTDSKRRRRDRDRDNDRDREEETAPPVSETPPAKPAAKGKGKELTVERAPNPKSIDNPAWIAPEDIVVWREHRDAVTCLAWNPKNRDVLATGSSDGTARLWDFIVGSAGRALETDRKPIVIKHTSIESSKKNVAALSWHPDGTVLATGECAGQAVEKSSFVLVMR
jgi:transducin (beta)-like 1